MTKLMNRFFLTVIFFVVSSAVHAGVDKASTQDAAVAETASVANVKISPELGKTQCASEPGKGIVLSWQGVNDKRQSPAVASLKNKKEEIDVKLAGSVDAVIGDALKAVFKNCGFDVKGKDDKGIETVVDVIDFYAGAKKGFFTGETDAKGALVVHFKGIGSTYDFNLGATKSDKRLKKKNLQQLEGVLSGLLESMVVQIGESPSLYAELKEMNY